MSDVPDVAMAVVSDVLEVPVLDVAVLPPLLDVVMPPPLDEAAMLLLLPCEAIVSKACCELALDV